jgi:hypothetical protein
VKVERHIFLVSALRGIQLSASAIIGSYHVLCATELAWNCGRRQSVAPASSPPHSLVTIPTELPWLSSDMLIGLMSILNYEPVIPSNGDSVLHFVAECWPA